MTGKQIRQRLVLTLAVAAVTASLAQLVACSSDDEARAAFDPEPDAGRVNLPEAAAPFDASADTAIPKPPFDPAGEAVVCAGQPCAVELVAGERHFCARLDDGTVRCWGDNEVGSLGALDNADAGADAGDAGNRLVKKVTGLAGATQLSAGGTTTCALVGDGGVACWGGNDRGQLGTKIAPPVSDDLPHPTPAPVALGGASASRVDVGQRSACALLASGKPWCWGDNTLAQLARSTPGEIGGPGEAVLGAAPIARLAAGTNTAFAVMKDGSLASWGAVAGPEGSTSARVASLSPDPSPLLVELGVVSSFSVSSTTLVREGGGFPRPPPKGVAHACAVVKGEVFCWGVSLMGALGTGLPEPATYPTRAVVPSEKSWAQQVSAAGDLTCVRLTDGTVQCAGDNAGGALGRDPTNAAFSMFFTPATGFTGHAVHVAAAAGAVCALVQGGTVQCWGQNLHRELGTKVPDDAPHPTAVTIGLQ